jgi:uncharacterized repeat protein (TIGR01451 family)
MPEANPAINLATSNYNYSAISVNPPTKQTSPGTPASVTVAENADVTTAKTADKAIYMPGETVTYTVTISNAGPGTALTPTVTDTMPSALTNQQYSIDNGVTWQTWTGKTTIAGIQPNSSATVLLRGVVDNTATGSLANSATTTTPSPNAAGGTNTSTGSTANSTTGDPVITDTANLTSAKTSDKTNYLPGETITYTINVTNSGSATSKTPTVNDTVPSAVQNPQYSIDGGATW